MNIERTTVESAGTIPALNPHEQLLNRLHQVHTCGQYKLKPDGETKTKKSRSRRVLEGYIWCNKYNRYTKPDHVGC